jgi:hypothetical protein
MFVIPDYRDPSNSAYGKSHMANRAPITPALLQGLRRSEKPSERTRQRVAHANTRLITRMKCHPHTERSK